MTVSHYTRRQALGLIGAGLVASPALAVPARPKVADPSGPYQVPGGRIGFARPQGIAPTTNGWILQSADHTFQVRVQETMAAPGVANPLWDKDASIKLTGTPAFPGFSARHFKDLRYDPNPDYRHESIVLAGEGWLGEMSVLTSDLGEQAEAPGPQASGQQAAAGFRLAAGPATQTAGLVARWQAAADLVLGSITVRPAPTAEQAMTEFAIKLDAAGLNARFAGDKLVLSAQAPRNSGEVLGRGIAHIALPAVSNLDYILEDANTELFEFFTITGTEITGGTCRGIQSPERRLPDGRYTTGVRLFGQRRQQEITAIYPVAERAATLEALTRTFKSLRFLDEG